MDDRVRRAEDLLEERRRTRGNGEDQTWPSDDPASPGGASPEVPEREALRAQGPLPLGPKGHDIEQAAKVDELTRDLQRVAADFANYRRRNEAERAEFARFAKAELITKLLEVLDNYDRALETVPGDLRTQPWVEGMWLVERKLRDILTSEGLETVDSVGKPFDPYIHEAIAHVDSDAPEGTVVDEVRKAYKLHDRVIRPALVTVAKRKESTHA